MNARQSHRARLFERLDPDVLGLGTDIRERLARLEQDLADLGGGEGMPPGFDPKLYIAPGLPRIRPVLVLLSTRAAQGGESESDAAEQVAVAAELLHAAIAVHDAALGQKGGRRRRAARRLLGGAVGWLGGNHLTLRALELAQHAPAPEIIGDLLEALREVADGHALATGFDNTAPSPDDVLAVAEGREGAVFNFACRSGARIAGADRRTIHSLGRYGRNTGIAWNLAEDLSAISGDQAAEILEDQADRGRPGITLSLAAAADPAIAADWTTLRTDPSPELARSLTERIQRTDALARGKEHLVRATWSARRALQNLEPTPERDSLDRLAAGLAK
jgi:geranylgeranyl pyrophosphate synthase